MQTTTNYGLKKPEGNEFVSVDDLNYNTEKIDRTLKGLDDNKVNASGGDVANTKVSEFTANDTQWPVPAAGEAPKTLWGKVKKFIEDFKNWMTGVCLIGQIVNNCVTDNAKLPLSAAQGKVLMDLYTVLNTKQNQTDARFQNFLRYEDVNLTATTDHFVTMTLSNPSQYKIPVLINPGSRDWEISVGWQYTTNILNLTGNGVAAGYTYTVRVFYFTL